MRSPLFRTFSAMSLAAAVSGVSAPAHAAVTILADSGDTAWLLGGAVIALAAAIPGMMLFFAGASGRASAQRIVTAAVAGMMLSALLYFAVGYSLMFDIVTNNAISGWLGGGANLMLNAMGTVREGTTVPETGFVVLRLCFILLSVAFLAAALAPRARPGWLLGFSALWTLLVLVPVNRWLSDAGWLSDIGALDYVGGLTVFYATGVSAFVALVLIGGKPADRQPMPVVQLGGAFLMLIGMAALAAASTGGASDDAAVAVINLLTSAATAALMLSALRRRLDAGTLALGLVGGLVGMLAGGDGVSVGGAWLMGVASAVAVQFAPRFIPKGFRWQDGSQTVIALTGAAKTGAFLFAIFIAFMPFGGSGYPDGMTMVSQMIAQLIAILAIAAWSVFGTLIAALSVSLLLPMRDTTTPA